MRITPTTYCPGLMITLAVNADRCAVARSS
jgi:hypothetical protein